MHPVLGLALLAPLTLTRAQAPAGSCTNPETTMPVRPCVSGVHIIAARGSNQSATANQGEGTLFPVAQSLLSMIPDSNSEGLQYPDSPAHRPCYDSSEEAGVANLTHAITDYAARCPETRIVLLGSSQGAQTVADTLCGSVLDPETQGPLDLAVGNHVAAIAIFGELSRNHTAPWNRGNASTVNTEDGFFPREDLASCMPYANKMASYCQSGDYWCDSSYGVSEQEAGYIHGMESTTYHDAAVQFVMQTLGM